MFLIGEWWYTLIIIIKYPSVIKEMPFLGMNKYKDSY